MIIRMRALVKRTGVNLTWSLGDPDIGTMDSMVDDIPKPYDDNTLNAVLSSMGGEDPPRLVTLLYCCLCRAGFQ